MKSKGFSIHVDGRPKDYPAGASVPANIAKKFDLVAKGLVEEDGPESLGGVGAGPSDTATPPPNEENDEQP